MVRSDFFLVNNHLDEYINHAAWGLPWVNDSFTGCLPRLPHMLTSVNLYLLLRRIHFSQVFWPWCVVFPSRHHMYIVNLNPLLLGAHSPAGIKASHVSHRLLHMN